VLLPESSEGPLVSINVNASRPAGRPLEDRGHMPQRRLVASRAMRRVSLIGIGLGVIVFVGVSVLLARAFNADGNEGSAITSLIQAEASGNPNGVISQIRDCSQSASCRALARRNAETLKHSGSVSILQLQPSTGFSLTSTLGYARVAWNVGGSLPRVQ